jgi:hypothetical protein
MPLSNALVSHRVASLAQYPMSESDDIPQLQMVWPTSRLTLPPPVVLPAGYRLRTYRTEVLNLWRGVCKELSWPYTPDLWPTALD